MRDRWYRHHVGRGNAQPLQPLSRVWYLPEELDVAPGLLDSLFEDEEDIVNTDRFGVGMELANLSAGKRVHVSLYCSVSNLRPHDMLGRSVKGEAAVHLLSKFSRSHRSGCAPADVPLPLRRPACLLCV